MKTCKVRFAGYDIDVKYHNPVFKEVEVENVIGVRDIIDYTTDDKEARFCTRCRRKLVQKKPQSNKSDSNGHPRPRRPRTRVR